MRVVVIGATGNVGTSLIGALGDDPDVTSVLGIARRVPRWQPPKVEWSKADITRDDLVPLVRGAEVVVHLGWLLQPTRNPILTWRVNVLGSARVFQAVARAGVPALVYASSVGAYSPGPRQGAVDESWPTDGWPNAAYTREKAYVERVLDAFELEHPHIRVVRMRPGFIFKRSSATGQRRLFAGPLLPGGLVRPGLVPVIPDLPGLRFQVLHADDAAGAYRRAITTPVRGAFNLAAEPVVDVAALARLLQARTLRVPVRLARAALAAAWRAHLVPVSPDLLDAVMRLPVMDTTRAREELGWTPQRSASDALSELLAGVREGADFDTPPLARATSGPLRVHEFRTGIGSRP
jgi:UDP-glucose 4-epimerase